MKRILITGKNSYIGTSVEKWLLKEPGKYSVDTIDMQNESWREHDFSKYDVVFHVAGIAHVKETKKNRDLYFKINRDLAYETAFKAKNDGVKQFIFLSSMSVYGIDKGVIYKDTPINPKSFYGKSKIEAEELINKLNENSYFVSVLRPPMVYGEGCKGNYPKLARLALKTPIFPKIDNKRSMIYIDNLSEFIKYLIDNRIRGLFFPQNSAYVNTSKMVKMINEVHGKRVVMTKLFNSILGLLNVSILNKIFGDLIYDYSMSEHKISYIVCEFEESIKKTESMQGETA